MQQIVLPHIPFIVHLNEHMQRTQNLSWAVCGYWLWCLLTRFVIIYKIGYSILLQMSLSYYWLAWKYRISASFCFLSIMGYVFWNISGIFSITMQWTERQFSRKHKTALIIDRIKALRHFARVFVPICTFFCVCRYIDCALSVNIISHTRTRRHYHPAAEFAFST